MTLMDTVPHSVGFIGAGAMAEAILSGWVAMGMVKPDQISACDPSEGRREVFQRMGAAVFENTVLVCPNHSSAVSLEIFLKSG
jgi:pyrroline-5-carboxylate reductase